MSDCLMCLLIENWLCILCLVKIAYSWIGRPVRTHKKSICRETKGSTTDLNIRMKSSRQEASNGGVQKFIFSFLFGELFVKK